MYYVKHHPLALFPTFFVFFFRSDLGSENTSSQGTGAKRVYYIT